MEPGRPVEKVSASPLHRTRWITEIIANTVIIGSVLVGGAVWLRGFVAGSSSMTSSVEESTRAPLVGTPVTLPGVTWHDQKSTLVVAISSACPHCVNDASFYSKLTRSAHRTPVVVAMPQQKLVAQEFLRSHGITPAQSISTDLGSLQIEATPTILLVSSTGLVQQAWVGELTAKQQSEVQESLDRL